MTMTTYNKDILTAFVVGAVIGFFLAMIVVLATAP